MGEILFPFIDYQKAKELVKDKSIPKEYAWDFSNNNFILQNGRMVILEGVEAIKVWIYKMFKTPRYRYLIYSWNYGHELENFIGDGYSAGIVRNEVKRLVEDALALNSRIKGVSNLKVSFEKAKLNVSFTALTDYGEVSVNV